MSLTGTQATQATWLLLRREQALRQHPPQAKHSLARTSPASSTMAPRVALDAQEEVADAISTSLGGGHGSQNGGNDAADAPQPEDEVVSAPCGSSAGKRKRTAGAEQPMRKAGCRAGSSSPARQAAAKAAAGSCRCRARSLADVGAAGAEAPHLGPQPHQVVRSYSAWRAGSAAGRGAEAQDAGHHASRPRRCVPVRAGGMQEMTS